MISKLLKRRRAPVAMDASIPAGQRVYAVGDIHGRLDLLDTLLTAIDADDAGRGAAETTVIFLGDLVDRGPNSAGVVARLRDLAAARPALRFLKGNHEELFLRAMSGDLTALRVFCRVGGSETATSYGLSETDYLALDHQELGLALRDLVPEEDRAFLEAFEDMVIIGDYAFVHAGVDPARSLADQVPTDLRWIRKPFLDHRGTLEKRIVHGHTIVSDVEWKPHRIGIDTGAYESGRLTALGLEGADCWTLST